MRETFGLNVGSRARLTILGSGTSQGVPMIGCDCPVCNSTDPRDKRLRTSAMVEMDGLRLVVDAGPDFRTQMLREKVKHIDGILLTHNHKDHTGGLDDIRAFNYFEKKDSHIYCEQYVLDSLKREYPYAFGEHKYPGAPEWRVHIIDNKPFTVTTHFNDPVLVWQQGVGYTHVTNETVKEEKSAEIIPVRVWHDKKQSYPILGYRFKQIVYLTDVAEFPDSEWDKLSGAEAITINCVKIGAPHYSHFCLEEAVDFAKKACDKAGISLCYLTHLSHAMGFHTELSARVALENRSYDGHPLLITPAYDGLVIE